MSKSTQTDKFRLFPNPAGDLIHIEFERLPDSPYDIEIYDLAGNKVISRREEKGQLQIKHQLLPGIYSIQIREADGSTFTKKLIIY